MQKRKKINKPPRRDNERTAQKIETMEQDLIDRLLIGDKTVSNDYRWSDIYNAFRSGRVEKNNANWLIMQTAYDYAKESR